MDPDWITQAEAQLSALMETLHEINDPDAEEMGEALDRRLTELRRLKEGHGGFC